ncbi:hypothetical protein [Nostoc sp.]|uniref:hypothetical protein n=1 Tax=Nostoc sp. TaxID=1180 RepID=UPI002FF77583
MSDRFLDILYVRPGIATVGRIMEKAIEDIWRVGWKPTHPADEHLRLLQLLLSAK